MKTTNMHDKDKISTTLKASNKAYASQSTIRSIHDAIAHTVSQFGDSDDSRRLHRVPTGFSEYDQKTGGLAVGKLTAIIGKPTMGQHILSMDIARHAAAEGVASLIISQMSINEICMRIISAETGMEMENLEPNIKLDGDERSILDAYYSFCENMPLYFMPNYYGTVKQIKKACRSLKKHINLKLVVINGVSCITKDPANLPKAMPELARLARELDIAVVFTASIRTFPFQGNRRPDLNYITDGAALRCHADTILIVHRRNPSDETENTNETKNTSETELILAQHPWLSTCTFNLRFQPEYSRFTDH